MSLSDPPRAPDRHDRAMTVAELAFRLDLSSKKVRGLIREGRLVARRIGRELRILPEDVKAFLDGCRVIPEVKP